jgi:hypothetical protein
MSKDSERLRDFAAVALADGRKEMSRQLKEIANRMDNAKTITK